MMRRTQTIRTTVEINNNWTVSRVEVATVHGANADVPTSVTYVLTERDTGNAFTFLRGEAAAIRSAFETLL